jgi:hypothetical protein
MRSKSEQMALNVIRVILAPVGVIGILLIWIYVLFTLGLERANYTVSEILDL